MTKFEIESFDWKNFNHEAAMLKSIKHLNVDFKKYIEGIKEHIFSSPKTMEIFLPLLENARNDYACVKELYDISNSIKKINKDKYSIKKKQLTQKHLEAVLSHAKSLRKLFAEKDFEEINNEILGIDHETYQSFSDSNYIQSWGLVEDFIFRILEDASIKEENKTYAKNIVHGIQSHIRETVSDYSTEEIDKHLASIEYQAESLKEKINSKDSRMHSLTISKDLPRTFKQLPSHGAGELIYPKKLSAGTAHITFFITNLFPFLIKNTSHPEALQCKWNINPPLLI